MLASLDLSAAFHTIDHDILIDRLLIETGIQGQASRWFRSYLSNHYHFVYLNRESSQLSPVKYGVLQGSVLGPLLFSIYMLPLGTIIRKYGISFHCWADNTQLYISTRPDETSKLSKLKESVQNVKDWMTNNFLLLNCDKTDITYWQWWSVTKYNYFVTVLKYIFQVSVLYWSSFILSNFYFDFTTFQSIRSYFLLHYIS